MSRMNAGHPLLALATLIPFAAGCGRSDARTTSTSEGATPTVSATATETESPVTVAPVTYEAAESAFSARRYPEAKELFTSYTESHPENAWGFYMLGMSAWKSGEHEKALSAFDQALQLDPKHRKSLFNAGRVLLEGGKAKEALERIEKGLALEPMSNEGLRLLGRARYELGNVDEAVNAYRQALAIDDRDVWSMNNLGLIYIQQDRSREALPPLARAVELRSNAPVFQNNLGTALEQSGYPTAAAQAYEAAIAVDSTYGKASVGLARVTGGGQEPESTAVDLTALSRQFEAEIETWRTQAVDSVIVLETVSDSAGTAEDTVGDSVMVSGRIASDTLEECETEEDK